MRRDHLDALGDDASPACRPGRRMPKCRACPARRRCARTRNRNRRCRRWRSRSCSRRAPNASPSRTRATSSAPRRRNRRRARTAQTPRSPRRAPPRAATASRCASLSGERDRAAAQSLHRECEIGQAVVVGERLARHAQRARIERGQGAAVRGRDAVAQPPAVAQRAHQAPARRIDVAPRRRRPTAAATPAHHASSPRRELAVRRRRRTASRECDRGSSRVLVAFELRRLLARRTPRTRDGSPASACRSPAPALPPRSPHRGPSPIPDAGASWSSHARTSDRRPARARRRARFGEQGIRRRPAG